MELVQCISCEEIRVSHLYLWLMWVNILRLFENDVHQELAPKILNSLLTKIFPAGRNVYSIDPQIQNTMHGSITESQE